MRQLIGLLYVLRHMCMVNCQITGDLRLNNTFNSSTYDEGRLEIYLNGQWGTVCDDYFSDIDAIVACRQLGHCTGIVVSSLLIADGSGNIWLDDVRCTGTESKLMNCTNAATHNCRHQEDVGIRCFSTCPTMVHGGWNIWSQWSICYCEGIQFRTRSCTNPVPLYGGQVCQGYYVEERNCSIFCYSSS